MFNGRVPERPPPELSVVVPVNDEADCIALFHSRLSAVLRSLGLRCEVIYVDDGSRDATPEILRRLQAEDGSVGLVVLSRNFGHQAALTAGLGACRGQAAVTLDADLQHPPELIPELVAAWRRGAWVVNTTRTGTEGVGLLKRLASASFYRILRSFSDPAPDPDSADFRLLDRRALELLLKMDERHRFLRGMVGWLGLPEQKVSFVAPGRAAGRAKYGWGRMWALAVDGIVSSSIRPLRAALWLGFGALLVDAAYAAYVLQAFLRHDVVRGWSSLILVSLFLGGIHLLLLGVMGEYVGRIYEEVKARPHFILKELLPPRSP